MKEQSWNKNNTPKIFENYPNAYKFEIESRLFTIISISNMFFVKYIS